MTAETTASANTSASAALHAGALIETRELRKTYGAGAAEITVLSGVTVSVDTGKLIAVIGPSGAGKSTFLHLLAALDTPTSGTVYFEGKAIDSFQERKLANYRNRSIGFVWQRHHLLADFTAAENVAMPMLMRGAGYGEGLEGSGGGRGSYPGGNNSAWPLPAHLFRSLHYCWPMSLPET